MTEPTESGPPSPARPLRRRVLAAGAALWLLILAFLLFIWPTPYRSLAGEENRRVHRLTGRVEKFDAAKRAWKPLKSRERSASVTSEGGSGSPIGGGSASSGGRDKGGGDWWHQDRKPRAKKGGGEGENWWYQEKKAAPETEAAGDEREEAPARAEEEAKEPKSDGWWHD